MTEFLNSFWQYLIGVIGDLLSTLFNVVAWVLYIIFDGFLATTYAYFDALDFSSVAFSMAAEMSSLPDQLIWLVNALTIPQCLTVVAQAMLLRVVMNLIPAAITRL